MGGVPVNGQDSTQRAREEIRTIKTKVADHKESVEERRKEADDLRLEYTNEVNRYQSDVQKAEKALEVMDTMELDEVQRTMIRGYRDSLAKYRKDFGDFKVMQEEKFSAFNRDMEVYEASLTSLEPVVI